MTMFPISSWFQNATHIDILIDCLLPNLIILKQMKEYLKHVVYSLFWYFQDVQGTCPIFGKSGKHSVKGLMVLKHGSIRGGATYTSIL